MVRRGRQQLALGSLLRWESLEKAAEIPPVHRIYVNRTLRMSGIEAIGFDMDHTLALYDTGPFERLAFEQAKQKLLAAGYPKEIEKLRYDASFVIRGLVVDKRRGNILKMDQHHYVARATHGTTPLPDEIRKRLYQRHLVRLSAREYVPVDSPFSLPEIDLYAQLVDLIDRLHWRPRSYRTLYDEVRRAMDEAHADGSIKDEIARAPGRFLLRDRALPRTLDHLKKHGYRLFLLTNSEASYTSLIMDRLLSRTSTAHRQWSEFFDLIVVRAGKPSFFGNRQTAVPIGLPGADSPAGGIKAFAGGGVRDLERRLGCRGDRILFFGDHTYGDILKSKRVCLWRTAMVVQELEKEVMTVEQLAEPLATLRRHLARGTRLDRVRDHVEQVANGTLSATKSPLKQTEARQLLVSLDRRIETLTCEILKLERACDSRHNVHWGSIFRTEHEASHFAAQVRDFACIYTGRVSNFLYYPVDKYFQVRPEVMPHER